MEIERVSICLESVKTKTIVCDDGTVPSIIESECRQGISSNDTLEHHDLLLHQGGQQRALPGIIESERRQGISSNDTLQHHDLLLHQGGQQRAATLSDQVHYRSYRRSSRGGRGRGDSGYGKVRDI